MKISDSFIKETTFEQAFGKERISQVMKAGIPYCEMDNSFSRRRNSHTSDCVTIFGDRVFKEVTKLK